jgi:hypothetical protein
MLTSRVAGSDLVPYVLISVFLRGGCFIWAPSIISRKEMRSLFFENVKFFRIVICLVVYATDSFRISRCILLIHSVFITDVTSRILEFLVSNLDPDTG